MGLFRLPAAFAGELIDHAQGEYPKEACGMIVGPPQTPLKLHRLTNIDPDPVMRYLADPREVKKVEDENFENDWEVLSIYHSHTHSPAFPSPTDVARVSYPSAVYLLVSLKDREAPDLRGFYILEGGNIEEIDVVVDEQATTG